MKHKKKLVLFALIALMAAPSLFGKSSVLVFITDMYDQRSIKPQEKGSMLDFPWGSVDTQGRLVQKSGANLNWAAKAAKLKNPQPRTADSSANGELTDNTVCAGCHGVAGDAVSKVNDKGMGAPPIAWMTKGFSDGHLYHKIKDASGMVMPPLGYATTAQERWDIINYIRAKVEK